MFHMLTNVQDGNAEPLQQCIHNHKGDLRVALRQITHTVGWFNVKTQQSFSWRRLHKGTAAKLYIPPGLYSLVQLSKRIKQAATHPALWLDRIDGLVMMRISESWEFQFTDKFLTLLGFDGGLHCEWLDHGTYTGDRSSNFAGGHKNAAGIH